MKKSRPAGNRRRSEYLSSILVPAVFCLVCGLLLTIAPNLAIRVTTYVIGFLLCAFGLWYIIRFLRTPVMERLGTNRLAIGLIALFAGCMLFIFPGELELLLPRIWGLALLCGAFLKVQYALDAKAVKRDKWWIMLIFAAVSLIIGALVLLVFQGAANYLVIGIMLLFEAAFDLFVWFTLRGALKDYLRRVGEVAPGSPDHPVPPDIPEGAHGPQIPEKPLPPEIPVSPAPPAP